MSLQIIDDQNFEQVITANELVILEFWAPWCNPCVEYGKIFEEVILKYPNINFSKINVEVERKLAKDLEVLSIPTTMVIKRGVVIFRYTGVIPKKDLISLVDEAIAIDVNDSNLTEASDRNA